MRGFRLVLILCTWFCQFWLLYRFRLEAELFDSLRPIARRHGHVFRMALHNEGDWRMETWQRARRASCHVSIRQSPSCVMPFWTRAKCLLAFISYLPMWIKAKYTFIKTVYSPRFYRGPYLQAKHADVSSGVLFWTACTRRRTCCHCHLAVKIRFMTASAAVKTAKKVMNGTTVWSCDTDCVQMASKQPNVEFSSHIFQFTRLHGVAVMQGLTLRDSVVTLVKSTRWYVLSGTGFLVAHQLYHCIHWKCDAQIQNRQIKSPPALWKHLSFQCLGVIRRYFEWQER